MASGLIESTPQRKKAKKMKYKRYCKTLKLEDDPQLIERYIAAHGKDKVWPEIGQGMREVGIIDMEIYIHGNTLFMIMDTEADFDHERAFRELASKPRQAEWEAHMSQFQKTTADASADEKWVLMERIFELDQQKEYKAADGQLKNNYED